MKTSFLSLSDRIFTSLAATASGPLKVRRIVAACLLGCTSLGVQAQSLPLVYSAENTGSATCATPPLPSFNQLPVVEPLPDPFMWSDGRGRSTSFTDWECRRNEIKAEIENYEIGRKPARPQNITASYAAGVLTVNVTENGQTLTLTSQVSLPTGSGRFPAIIGMNSPSGSVPASVFTNRNIARITFSHNQVTTYSNPQPTDPYYRLYPDQNLTNAGQYSAWAWGVSRIIDGLELVQASLPIDLTHLGVTGCSYAGKMALFSGAFDERIALTIAQESGGGGAPAWRVSETLGAVEKLGATDYRWFKDDMQQFAGSNVAKLPHDHHELMAMIAPRALLVTGNTDFEWLANPAAYVSARAAHEVWKTFGVGDRFGFYIDGGHGHCAIPGTQLPAVEAFVDKFMLGNTNVNTDITVNPYPLVNYQRWYQWWGTNNPVLPAEPLGKRIWLEAGCAAVGSDWQTVADPTATNGSYLVVNGLNSTAAAPGPSGQVTFSFNVDSAATYNFVARLNCPTANDDSYWVKIDNGAFATINGLTTSGWQWTRLTSSNLSVGPHTLTIGYREDGAQLDKLLVTTSNATITGLGGATTEADTTPPVIKAAGFMMAIERNGTRTIEAADVDWGSYDNCSGVASMTLDKTTFTCANMGPNQVTLTVTDNAGNSTSETVTVMLVDNTAPTIMAAGFQVSLMNGTRKIEASDVDYGSTDDCGIASMTISPSTFTCANIGPNEVTLTCVDNAGNSASKTVTVLVTGDASCLSSLGGLASNTVSSGPAGELQAFPNPATEQATISFKALKAGAAQVLVYNTLGRLVATLYDGPVEAGGQYSATLDSRALPGGVYTCQLRTPSGTKTTRLLVVK
ncbi:T9SS type A sorting domain-containing protein [Hymenobacter norwichensis]|uniref:glucuronyl esterase domain-containing protein n=1 Tax=Hymenobacter norwichensis TaxID=223903 RepID=UPI0004120FCD|nr:T9SS type A sorting domain-containing protein [Hymenobacter norwichensis]